MGTGNSKQNLDLKSVTLEYYNIIRQAIVTNNLDTIIKYCDLFVQIPKNQHVNPNLSTTQLKLLDHYGGRYDDYRYRVSNLEMLFYEAVAAKNCNVQIAITLAGALNMYRSTVLTNLILRDVSEKLIENFSERIVENDRCYPIVAAIIKKNRKLVMKLSENGRLFSGIHAYYIVKHDLDIEVSEKLLKYALYYAVRNERNIGYDHYPNASNNIYYPYERYGTYYKISKSSCCKNQRKRNTIKVLNLLGTDARIEAINYTRKVIERALKTAKENLSTRDSLIDVAEHKNPNMTKEQRKIVIKKIDSHLKNLTEKLEKYPSTLEILDELAFYDFDSTESGESDESSSTFTKIDS